MSCVPRQSLWIEASSARAHYQCVVRFVIMLCVLPFGTVSCPATAAGEVHTTWRRWRWIHLWLCHCRCRLVDDRGASCARSTTGGTARKGDRGVPLLLSAMFTLLHRCLLGLVLAAGEA